MKVLIGCEHSGVVRDAFIREGHEAMSCDLLPTESPGPHYQGDIRDVLNDGWDLAIFHPPCTHLAVSGAAHFAAKIADGRQQDALDFVRLLMNAPIQRIAIENPVSIISTHIRKPDQIIQPWMFGHDKQKATCLWLKNLPLLKPTKYIDPTHYGCECGHRFPIALGKHGCPNCEGTHKTIPIYSNQTPSGRDATSPSQDRWKLRSKTYEGIAHAMATQWTKPHPIQAELL